MSATLGIINQIKSLVDIVKKKDKKNKETTSANRALINKLLGMQSAYNNKEISFAPEYSQTISISNKPSIKSDIQLQEEAAKHVSDLLAENKKKAEAKAYEKIVKLEDKQLKAYRKFTDSQDKLASQLDSQKEYITSKVIRQGLTHSSIRDDWQQKNTQDYLSAMEYVKRDYADQVAQIEAQINIINTAKIQSLADYDLALASAYEKRLQQLREEQIKIIEKQDSYNRFYQGQMDILEQEQLEQELLEGYSGEKAIEMENRYQQALSFYKSLDKKRALNLIEDNKLELKQTLGWYYMRLIEEINKK